MEYLEIKKGDIFLVDLSEHGMGKRPVVIISSDFYNKHSIYLFGVPINSSLIKCKLPMHVLLPDKFRKLGFVQTERILTFNRSMVLNKIGNTNADKNFIEKLNKNLINSFTLMTNIPPIKQESREEHKRQLEEYERQLKEYERQLNKPLVITEGKTDCKLIETAWKKLYPNKEMFFECIPSGIEEDKESREGNADNVRRTIEYLSNVEQRPIIGLFDNDKEGNVKFKGLNKKIFEKYDINKDFRKHNTKNVWGLLLPVTDERRIFVTNDDISQRYFVIEHYFSDFVLKQYNMYGKNILETCVFKVNKKKDKFSREVNQLSNEEFENFKILFSKIKSLLGSN